MQDEQSTVIEEQKSQLANEIERVKHRVQSEF